MKSSKLAALTALVVLVAMPAAAQCPAKKPTPTVRVIFGKECGAITLPMDIWVGDVKRELKLVNGNYEANYEGDRRLADMKLEIGKFGEKRDCCYKPPRHERIAPGKDDCYLEYSVSCDRPGWTLAVESKTPLGIERMHADERGKTECQRSRSDLSDNLSERDDVTLIVPKGSTKVQLTLAELVPRKSFEDLKIVIDAPLEQEETPFGHDDLMRRLKQAIGTYHPPDPKLSQKAKKTIELFLSDMLESLPKSVKVKKAQ